MKVNVDGLIGAGYYERGETRQTWRNGYGERFHDTGLGTLNLNTRRCGPEPTCPLPGAGEDREECAGRHDPGGMERWVVDERGR
jgi:hypothetical protein